MISINITIDISGKINKSIITEEENLQQIIKTLDDLSKFSISDSLLKNEKELIKKLYIDDDLSSKEICKILNIGDSAFWERIKKYGLHKTDVNLTKDAKGTKSIDIDELKKLFVDENLSKEECAERLGVHINAVQALVIKYELAKLTRDYDKEFDLRVSDIKKVYIDKNYTVSQTANIYKVPTNKISRFINKHGFKKANKTIFKENKSTTEDKKEIDNSDTINKIINKDVSKTSIEIENYNGDYDEEFNLRISEVKKLYNEEDKTISQTARILRRKAEEISRFINKHGLRKVK